MLRSRIRKTLQDRAGAARDASAWDKDAGRCVAVP